MNILSPERDDVLLSGRAPKHIRKFLREAGGVTPWGENRYRLVKAEWVMRYCGARWTDWPEGVDLLDQGGLEFSEETRTVKHVCADPTDPTKSIVAEMDVPARVSLKSNQPLRVVEEMRWIKIYPHDKGWMLQAWYPASFYSPSHYEVTVTGRPDLPLLGTFPSKGQYERQFGYILKGLRYETFPSMPGESWMERAIQHHESRIGKINPNLDEDDPARNLRMVLTLEEMKEARMVYEKSQQEELESKIKDKIGPIFGSSLAAGRYREELANQARAKGVVIGHCGN